MSTIGVVLEPQAESRVSATPETVKAIRALGYQVLVEKGAGAKASFPDSAYVAAGAKVGTMAATWKSDTHQKTCRTFICDLYSKSAL